MSTRSLICKKIGPDKYRTIYCHSDGYLTFNGAMLIDHYTDEQKVDKLLDLGDISCLAEKTEPDPTKPHSFDYNERQEGVVVAYGRDRGEQECEARELSFDQLIDNAWIEYIYIFDENGSWKYIEYPTPEETNEIKDVKEDLYEYYKRIGIKRCGYGFLTDEAIKEIKKKQSHADEEM